MSRVDDITTRIMRAMDEGLLVPGQRLPALRQACLEYGVAKNTMVEVYDRLVARGRLEARRGSGFYVLSPGTSTIEIVPPAHMAEAVDLVTLLREQLEQVHPVRVGDGRPPPSWAEESELGRHLRPSTTRAASPVSHGYGEPIGYAPLRHQIALMLAERSIPASPDRIVLTFGANHGLDLIIRHLLQPGDKVLVDSPGYYPLFGKLKLMGIEAIGVRRNPDGPDLDDLAAQIALHAPKVFFTQTLAHNPTGGSMSLGIAHRLLHLTERAGITVVEDDPFGDVLPATQVRLAALDGLNHVIYLGTFSKTLSASLRIGYLAAQGPLAQALVNMKMLTVVNSSGYLERMVADLISSGQYRHHLRRLRERIAKASTRAHASLEKLGLPPFSPAGGGYYLWAELPDGIDDVALAREASREGIFIAPGSVFFPDKAQVRPGLRINVAYADDARFLNFLRTNLGASAR